MTLFISSLVRFISSHEIPSCGKNHKFMNKKNWFKKMGKGKFKTVMIPIGS
jgi:hypothetical protein